MPTTPAKITHDRRRSSPASGDRSEQHGHGADHERDRREHGRDARGRGDAAVPARRCAASSSRSGSTLVRCTATPSAAPAIHAQPAATARIGAESVTSDGKQPEAHDERARTEIGVDFSPALYDHADASATACAAPSPSSSSERQHEREREGRGCRHPRGAQRHVAARDRLVGAAGRAVAGCVDGVVGDADRELAAEDRERSAPRCARARAPTAIPSVTPAA